MENFLDIESESLQVTLEEKIAEMKEEMKRQLQREIIEKQLKQLNFIIDYYKLAMNQKTREGIEKAVRGIAADSFNLGFEAGKVL